MAAMQMNVPALLTLARRRSNERAKSLKKRIIYFVAANVGDYVHGKKKLKKWPLIFREMVLQQLMQLRCEEQAGVNSRKVKRIIKAYSQLVCQKTKKVELEGFFSFCREGKTAHYTRKVLKAILPKAAGLRHLNLRANFTRNTNIYERLKKNSMRAILEMENLRIIQFSMVKYKHVKRICRNLKQLQYVKCEQLVSYEEKEENIEDFKSCFSRLKVFLFTRGTFSLDEELIKLCIQHLPKLEVVHEFADCKRYLLHKPDLTVPEETSALTHLHASPETMFDHPAEFPNVTHLKVFCSNEYQPKYNKNSILRFESVKIESLALCIPQRDSILKSFLEAYGANLHTLIITARGSLDYFSFREIFDACPKLQKLELISVLISDDNMTLESFAQLRDFHWKPRTKDGLEFEVTNILAAPNLEKFSLEYLTLDLRVDDLRKLTSLVADQETLCKLTTLSLVFEVRNSGVQSYRQYLRALRDFVAVAAAHLPNLVDFKLGLLRCIIGNGWMIDFQSDKQIDLEVIGAKFQQWIGDDSIVEFIRAINARNQH